MSETLQRQTTEAPTQYIEEQLPFGMVNDEQAKVSETFTVINNRDSGLSVDVQGKVHGLPEPEAVHVETPEPVKPYALKGNRSMSFGLDNEVHGLAEKPIENTENQDKDSDEVQPAETTAEVEAPVATKSENATVNELLGESVSETEQAPTVEPKKVRFLGKVGMWLVKNSEKREANVQASKDARTKAEASYKENRMYDEAYSKNKTFIDDTQKTALKMNRKFDRNVKVENAKESTRNAVRKTGNAALNGAAIGVAGAMAAGDKVADISRKTIEVASSANEQGRVQVQRGRAATQEQVRAAREYYHRKIANGLNDAGEGILKRANKILDKSVVRSEKAEELSAQKI